MRVCRRNGFTLIEVLIAMTLLGVMVVLLFSSLRIAAESWNAGEGKIAEVNQKAVVYQFFKRHLTAIRPLPMLTVDETQHDDPGQTMAFRGLPSSLRFVGALPAASARKGLQLFTIQPDPKLPSTLQVSLVPYRQDEPDGDVVDPPVILLERVKAFRLAYFGKTEDVAEQDWREEWTLADRLPSLIKVSITLEDGGYWPEMVFPLHITAANNAETASVADTESGDESVPNVDTR